ncbi:DUF1090 domain-containing protein [Rahnella sp. C60]|jgi:hypothetical protein|uniref:DUF1090 domain-containing protein n=1 Tax=Rahnella perminowiae TaxID=2816244 RepID=A0ABS6KZU2_9GAMM|nr:MULTISPECIES: DUF1090 domain-containing protein [Rahnella]MBU9809884.1 DUF1090 domain-containing protein [Rahnella perminowiae]MBU9817017.1 DUF1090 domain-containing protein [Rahnella perminowiae]MBU9825932.1 DUF1090 domain-containing protein [Rahnella perminowiae]MBU9834963.1 DUF1090 domain-containing protein [Rahnella perminowiae]MCX2943149.1 DUF1090 domain-containing protein [Rahnella perminowiae]
MKITLSALTLVPALLFTTAAFAAPQPESCVTKQQEIQKQIGEARAHNNQNRIDGLEKALRENKAHCTDAGLKAENQKRVDEKREKVAEREQELKEALAKGDHEKILRKQQKLEEATSELKEAEGH